jgi:CheY-like chemotaxis protein
MGYRILLAEDDPSVLKMTKLRLEHAGYQVVPAVDGQDALDQVASHGPVDLILLDLNMPKLDGLQVCQRLKANAETAKIPVIIFSASETYQAKMTDLCLELGANDWIAKPFRSQELLGKIQQVIQGHEHARAHVTAKAGEPVRVLVVDDDPAIHAYFTSILPAAQFQIVAVKSGQEAIAAVKQAPCFLAFVDVVMPGIDGLATMKELLKAQPRLPVIMMTGHQIEDIATIALHAGASDFLAKPLGQTGDVLAMIERVRQRA